MKPKSAARSLDGAAHRRAPIQARSRERMTRILDEAAVLFADLGFDATTIEAIAERAKTSVGSVYQFFPNKQAVFDALATRYKEQVEALFAALASPRDAAADKTPWVVEMDRAVEAFAEFHRSDAGFRAVWLGGHTSRELLAEGFAMGRAIAEHTATLLAPYLPGVTPSRRRAIATVVVETAFALMVVAAQQPTPAAGDRIVDEIKVILRRYLAPSVREARTTKRGSTAKRRR